MADLIPTPKIEESLPPATIGAAEQIAHALNEESKKNVIAAEVAKAFKIDPNFVRRTTLNTISKQPVPLLQALDARREKTSNINKAFAAIGVTDFKINTADEDDLSFLEALHKGVKSSPKSLKRAGQGLTSLIGLFYKYGIDLLSNPEQALEDLGRRAPDAPKALLDIGKVLIDPYTSEKKFKKFLSEDLPFVLLDATTGLGLGSAGLMGLSTGSRVLASRAASASTKAAFNKAANISAQLSVVTKPANLAKATAKPVAKEIIKIIPGAENLRTLNPVVDKVRTLLFRGVEFSPIRQERIANKIAESLTELTTAERGLIMPAIEGTFSGEMSRGLNKAVTTIRDVLKDQEDSLVRLGKLSPETIELRAWQPLTEKSGLSIDDLKKTIPQDQWPTYYPHLFADKVDFETFLGLKKPKLSPKQSEFFLKKSDGALGYLDDPAILTGAILQRQRYIDLVSTLKRIETRWAKPWKVGEPLLPNHSALNIGTLEKGIDFYGETLGKFYEAVKQKGRHIDDFITRDGREIFDGLILKYKEHSPALDRFVQMPKEVARELKYFEGPLDKLSSIAGLEKIAQMTKSGLDIWRAAVLAWSPRWYVNNMIGNLMLSLISGTRPSSYIRALQKKWTDIVPEEVRLGTWAHELSRATKDKLLSHNPALPEMAELFVNEVSGRKDPGLIKRLFFSVSDEGFKINKKIDDFFRNAKAIDAMTKRGMIRRMTAAGAKIENSHDLLREIKNIPGNSLTSARMTATAIKSANEAMLDFHNLGPFERHILRRAVFPFYTFHKAIATYALSLPIKFPGRTQVLRFLSLTGQHIQDKELAKFGLTRDELPIWIKGAMPIGRDEEGELLYVNAQGANIFYALGNFDTLQLLSPPIQVALALFGIDTFRKEFVREANVFQHGTNQFTINEETGDVELIEKKTLHPTFAFNELINSIPQTQALISTLAGGKRFRPDEFPFFSHPMMDKVGNLLKDEPLLAWLKLAGIPLSKKDIDQVLLQMEIGRKRATRTLTRQKAREELAE